MEGSNSVPEVPRLFYQGQGAPPLSVRPSAVLPPTVQRGYYPLGTTRGFTRNSELKVGGLQGLGAGAGHQLIQWLSEQLGCSPWW